METTRHYYSVLTGIEENTNESLISIFPNPSKNDFVISMGLQPRGSNMELEIYNSIGEKIFNQKTSSQLC
ncbi:hypothetical protein BH11BAC1_BH11BAC1_01260 [soil metagenome]